MKIITIPSALEKQSGVTLIEILVTVLILSIGLLGLAALQSTSIKLSYDSYLRSQAEFLAYDLIDRARANPTAAPYTVSGPLSLPGGDCYTDECSVAQLRAIDLHQWQEQVKDLLPSKDDAQPIGTVTFDTATNLYTLTLEWQDRYDQDVDGSTTDKKEFVYHFQVN